MNTFKRKSLYAAVASLAVAGTAQAVNVNPDGTGQVLIYPYYTVNTVSGKAFNSLMSIVNTSASAKAVKVRFREGRSSQEVLDFNLFLSPFDVWTAALSPAASGGTLINTSDTSCTVPKFPAGGVEFRNLKYTGDGAGDGLDRTREGYAEVLEMATFLKDTHQYSTTLHVGGAAPECAAIEAGILNNQSSPSGGLMGGMQLINVNAGASTAVAAVALANFRSQAFYTIQAGTDFPKLNYADPNSFSVAETVYNLNSTWNTTTVNELGTPTVNGSIDAVSAALMHAAVLNEYVLDTPTASQTAWVLTFPTKHHYIKVGTGSATQPFQKNFGATGSCDEVSLATYSREEQKPSGTQDFSPNLTPTASLCWEANVITFNSQNAYGSANVRNVNTTYQAGWMRVGLDLTDVLGNVKHQLVAPGTGPTWNLNNPVGTSFTSTNSYIGMPVVGFAAFTYNNGVVAAGSSLVYGLGFAHRYETVYK